MLAHRIADPRVLRLIRMWLEAGILESGEWHETDRGTPQGRASARSWPTSSCTTSSISGSISGAAGRRAVGSSIVRYADDFVMGFENAADAQRMLARSQGAAGQVRPGAPRGQDAPDRVRPLRRPWLGKQRGERRPETFAFLGFTHYCGWTRDGRFIVKHKTQSKRLTRKLTALRQEAWRLMHAAAGRAASLVRQRAARPLRLLRHAAQLAGSRTRSGRKSGASGSTACDGGARRTGAWAGTGSRL